jgi:hypothetical protein
VCKRKFASITELLKYNKWEYIFFTAWPSFGKCNALNLKKLAHTDYSFDDITFNLKNFYGFLLKSQDQTDISQSHSFCEERIFCVMRIKNVRCFMPMQKHMVDVEVKFQTPGLMLDMWF